MSSGPPHDYSTWHTGTAIRDHYLSTTIINQHHPPPLGNYVFDPTELSILKKFVLSPTIENRDVMLKDLEMEDGPDAAYPGEKAGKKGSLTALAIARHGTGDPVFDERDLELLKGWFEGGMPYQQNVSR